VKISTSPILTLLRRSPSQALIQLAGKDWLNRLMHYPVRRGPEWVREPLLRYKRKQQRLAAGMVPVAALHRSIRHGLSRLVERLGRENVGDYLEFGVNSGSSMVAMYHELNRAGLGHVRLFGFDSFEGLPAHANNEDAGVWAPGDYRCDIEFARQILCDEGVEPARVVLTPGWFSETLTPSLPAALNLKRASVVMVDCDMYSSAKEALTFTAPLLTDHALVLFDDWHSGNLADMGLGEKKAFDEVLAADFTVETLPSYSPNAEVVLLSRR
jgi:hypothetical protein